MAILCGVGDVLPLLTTRQQQTNDVFLKTWYRPPSPVWRPVSELYSWNTSMASGLDVAEGEIERLELDVLFVDINASVTSHRTL